MLISLTFMNNYQVNMSIIWIPPAPGTDPQASAKTLEERGLQHKPLRVPRDSSDLRGHTDTTPPPQDEKNHH